MDPNSHSGDCDYCPSYNDCSGYCEFTKSYHASDSGPDLLLYSSLSMVRGCGHQIHLAAFLLLAFIPFFSSLGTDAEFRYRGTIYASGVFAGSYVLLLITPAKWLRWGFISFLILCSWNLHVSPPLSVGPAKYPNTKACTFLDWELTRISCWIQAGHGPLKNFFSQFHLIPHYS